MEPGISVLLSRFHLLLSSLKQFILPLRQSWLKASNYCKPTRNLNGKGVKERKGQSSLGFGRRVENSVAESVSKMLRVFSCVQLVAFSGPSLLPLEAVCSLPFSHPAKVSLQPSTHFHPLRLARGTPVFPPLLATCTGPWQPLMLPLLEVGLA